MSILVMTTMTGTFSARAIPRCSLYVVNYIKSPGQNMVYSLAHAHQAIVCSDHQQAVVGLTGQKTKDSSA
jgi:hypothetical protein